jgi:hypothetical protein
MQTDGRPAVIAAKRALKGGRQRQRQQDQRHQKPQGGVARAR